MSVIVSSGVSSRKALADAQCEGDRGQAGHARTHHQDGGGAAAVVIAGSGLPGQLAVAAADQPPRQYQKDDRPHVLSGERGERPAQLGNQGQRCPGAEQARDGHALRAVGVPAGRRRILAGCGLR